MTQNLGPGDPLPTSARLYQGMIGLARQGLAAIPSPRKQKQAPPPTKHKALGLNAGRFSVYPFSPAYVATPLDAANLTSGNKTNELVLRTIQFLESSFAHPTTNRLAFVYPEPPLYNAPVELHTQGLAVGSAAAQPFWSLGATGRGLTRYPQPNRFSGDAQDFVNSAWLDAPVVPWSPRNETEARAEILWLDPAAVVGQPALCLVRIPAGGIPPRLDPDYSGTDYGGLAAISATSNWPPPPSIPTNPGTNAYSPSALIGRPSALLVSAVVSVGLAHKFEASLGPLATWTNPPNPAVQESAYKLARYGAAEIELALEITTPAGTRREGARKISHPQLFRITTSPNTGTTAQTIHRFRFWHVLFGTADRSPCKIRIVARTLAGATSSTLGANQMRADQFDATTANAYGCIGRYPAEPATFPPPTTN